MNTCVYCIYNVLYMLIYSCISFEKQTEPKNLGTQLYLSQPKFNLKLHLGIVNSGGVLFGYAWVSFMVEFGFAAYNLFRA